MRSKKVELPDRQWEEEICYVENWEPPKEGECSLPRPLETRKYIYKNYPFEKIMGEVGIPERVRERIYITDEEAQRLENSYNLKEKRRRASFFDLEK